MNVHILTLILTIAISTFTFGQRQTDREVSIQLQEKGYFYHVDDRNRLISDTIFTAKSGFKIEPDYETVIKNSQEYYIFRYPRFNCHEYSSDYIPDSLLSDTLTIEDISDRGIRVSIKCKDDRILMMSKSIFESLQKRTVYDASFFALTKKRLGFNIFRLPYPVNLRISTGLVTVPFKLRPAQEGQEFSMTTDVTIGPYLGLAKRISRTNPYYITLPATLGLTFVNVNDNTTTRDFEGGDVDVVPGYTWSSGLIIQLNKFSLGYVLGQDFASDVGDKWIYNGNLWHSFSIGYSFLNVDE
jgi:hypothetical protein